MRTTSFLRYLGNTLLVLGHFTLLWGDTQTALTIKIIGGLSLLPFAISWKLWDVVALELIFGGMDVTKFIQLVIGEAL